MKSGGIGCVIAVILLLSSIPIIPEMSAYENPSKTIYVDDDNTDGPWDGSQEYPYQHIQDAIDATSDGDTVFVYNGTYYENLVVNKSVTINGENQKTVIIDGGNRSSVLFVSADLVHIYNLTLRSSKIGYSSDARIMMYSNSSMVCNSIIDTCFSPGIFFCGNNNVFRKNLIKVKGWGIEGSSNGIDNIIENNVISNSGDFGIYLTNPKNNSICGNSISNKTCGISLLFPSNNVLRNNTMINCGLLLELDIYRYINNIDTSNTVNGKPIYHYVNKKNVTVPQDAGQVIFVRCIDCKVSGTSIKNSTRGIQVYYSRNISIIQNNIKNGLEGIHLLGSYFNKIERNIISNCGIGVFFDFSSANNISNNNLNNDRLGIRFNFNCYINKIYKNYIYNNSGGIYFWAICCNNTVEMNLIKDNDRGIYLNNGSYNNLFFHNDFVNNGNGGHVKDCNLIYKNLWDNGYPSGGNYWDDYLGIDSDGDDIGDVPYNISGGDNQDRYPLMEPYSKIEVEIKGGFGFKIIIYNVGRDVLEIFTVLFFIDCPLVIGGQISGGIVIIESFNPNEEVIIGAFIFGLGKVTIHVSINWEKWKAHGFIFGPFVFIQDYYRDDRA